MNHLYQLLIDVVIVAKALLKLRKTSQKAAADQRSFRQSVDSKCIYLLYIDICIYIASSQVSKLSIE